MVRRVLVVVAALLTPLAAASQPIDRNIPGLPTIPGDMCEVGGGGICFRPQDLGLPQGDEMFVLRNGADAMLRALVDSQRVPTDTISAYARGMSDAALLDICEVCECCIITFQGNLPDGTHRHLFGPGGEVMGHFEWVGR